MTSIGFSIARTSSVYSRAPLSGRRYRAHRVLPLFFSLLGVKAARARSSVDVTRVTRRYTTRLPKLLHAQITPTRYRAFSSALGRVHSVALRASHQIRERDDIAVVDVVARPPTLILRDRLARTATLGTEATHRHKRKATHCRATVAPPDGHIYRAFLITHNLDTRVLLPANN